MIDWKSKPVQFAVGVTTLIVVAYLVFSGDGALMLAAFSAEPTEGETKAGSVWSVVWPILFNVGTLIGAAVIAGVTRVWDWLVGLASKQPAPVQASNQSMNINQASEAFLRAVALGDDAEAAKLKPLIRIPYAQQQAIEALQASDFDKARKLIADIEAMSGGKK